jgi:hypothetical protein
MTAYDGEVLGNGLAVLYNKGEIEGVKSKDFLWPTVVTNYRLP